MSPWPVQERATVALWLKDLAPSAELRKWIDRHRAMRIEFKYDRKRREERDDPLLPFLRMTPETLDVRGVRQQPELDSI